MAGRINVTKAFLPPIEEYKVYIDKIWQSAHLTNHGPLLNELELELSHYLDIPFVQFCTNGTITLQIALKALGLEEGDEVISTPFSYVASTTAILWEHYKPVFVDIDPKTLCLEPKKIKEAITPLTKAILPVHVYGYPCDVEGIEKIAKEHDLKVLYDAAHTFGTRYKGRSLLSYGDIASCSFHATKLFHTGEGGGVFTHDQSLHDKMFKFKSFGHIADDYYSVGINGKNSEFHAAMGLTNLPYIEAIIAERKRISEKYDAGLKGLITRPSFRRGTDYNYAYYPVLFKNEDALLRVFAALKAENIYARRYFYPSLNRLPYLSDQTSCPIAEDIASRVACLPLYVGLEDSDIERIIGIIQKSMQ